MISFEKSFWTSKSPQEVFDYLSDPTNDAEWRESSVAAEWTSDSPHGVGSTYKSVDKLMGRKIEATQEITAWDSPNQFGFKGASGPMSFELTMTFEAQDNGTKATISVEAQSGGLFKMAENLFGKQMEKQFSTDMASLKRVMGGGTK